MKTKGHYIRLCLFPSELIAAVAWAVYHDPVDALTALGWFTVLVSFLLFMGEAINTLTDPD